MEPIVSPWFIYAIGIADGALETWSTLGALLTIAMLFTFIGIFYDVVEENSKAKKPWRLGVPVFIVVMWWLAFIFFPTSKTLMGMAVASQITPNRVVKTGKIVYAVKDDLKKDIIDIITAVNDKANVPKK